MDPKVWGPGLWKYLHSAAAIASTPEAINAFLAFIAVLGPTIPCKKCKAHFLENQRKIDIRSYTGSAEQLFMWTFRMHDAVNQAQGKVYPQRISYLEARAMYFDVADDNGAVGPVNVDPALCEEICSSTNVKVTSNISSDGRLIVRSENSNHIKIKPRVRKR